MAYDKILIDDDGEEYPYCVSLDNGLYYYKISVVWKNRDGELVILNEGSHIQFDDGSWLDFNMAPEEVFPNKTELSESDLLLFMKVLDAPERKPTILVKEEIEILYQKYMKTKNK